MIKKKLLIYISIILVLGLSLVLYSCQQKSGSTIEEPKITVEYLRGEYVDTLVKDGAEKFECSIESIETIKDGPSTLTLDGKEIIKSSSEAKGYYIANNNIIKKLTMDGQTRTVYEVSEGEFEILNADEFIIAFNDDIKNNGKESALNKIYQVYYIGDQAILILAHDFEKE